MILGQLQTGGKVCITQFLHSGIDNSFTGQTGQRLALPVPANQHERQIPGQQDTVCRTLLETDPIVLLETDESIC